MSATQGGPGIVQRGLVFYVDAANRSSYVSGSSVWNDLTEFKNNGTLVNGPTYTNVNAGSLVFDGLNDYVRVPSASIFIPPNDISINTWFNLSKYDSMIAMASNGGAPENEFMVYANAFSFFPPLTLAVSINAPGSPGWIFSSTQLSLNQWINACVTRSGSLVSIYLDGSLNNTGTQSGAMSFPANAPLLLGVDADGTNPEGGLGNWFGGILSNFSLYNRALTQSEVLQNYNAIRPKYYQ